MKLIKNDSSEMVFRSRTHPLILIFLLTWAICFGGIPLFMVFELIRDSGNISLVCDRQLRNQVNCQISKSQFFGLIPGKSEKIEGIISAKQVTNTSNLMVDHLVDISAKTGNVIYGQGSEYMSGVRGNLSESIFVANSINQFIVSSEMKLVATQNVALQENQIFYLLILSPFILIGSSVFYFTSQVETLTLDRNQGLVSRRISLLGITLSQKSFLLADANRVIIEDYIDSYHNCYFTPVIQLTSGEKFFLERVGHRDQALIMANQIRQFLHIPVET
jgi:hypothetical protein